MPAKVLAEHLIGGIAIADLPRGEVTTGLRSAFGGTRVHRAADSEHPVSARSILLDLRGRRVRPDVLAGAQA